MDTFTRRIRTDHEGSEGHPPLVDGTLGGGLEEMIITVDNKIKVTNAPKELIQRMSQELIIKNPKHEASLRYSKSRFRPPNF